MDSRLITLAAVALTMSGLASAADKPAAQPLEQQERIPFVQHGSIRDWQADRQQGLWIQDTHRKWYYARTMGPCFGLDWAWHIGFDTRPNGTLDRFSSILVPREGRCALSSLTRSEAPPPKRKKKDAGSAEPSVEI